MRRRRSITALTWSFVPYALVSTVHVVLLATESDVADVSKVALMPLLAVPVIRAARRLRPATAIALLLAALLFSWIGDSAGVFLPAGAELPVMLGFFGLAHIAYISLFARRLARRRLPWWALAYAVWWITLLILLGPHTGDLFLAVAAYGLVLAATATLSARCSPLIATGGALFLASDTLLALRLFLPGGLPEWSDPAIMSTYTLGQGLIVAGALLALQRRSEDA